MGTDSGRIEYEQVRRDQVAPKLGGPSDRISLTPVRRNKNDPKYTHTVLGAYGVYRIFNYSGELLYVGASRNFKYRMHSHAGSKPWRREVDDTRTTVEWFDSIEEASMRETEIIATENPLYNIHGKPGQTRNGYKPKRR